MDGVEQHPTYPSSCPSWTWRRRPSNSAWRPERPGTNGTAWEGVTVVWGDAEEGIRDEAADTWVPGFLGSRKQTGHGRKAGRSRLTCQGNGMLQEKNRAKRWGMGGGGVGPTRVIYCRSCRKSSQARGEGRTRVFHCQSWRKIESSAGG